jgi:hypothetical protein
MTIDHKLVYLEKYSTLAKRIIYETQELAEAKRHSFITPTHLAITIASAMDQDALNKKMGVKNKTLFSDELKSKFFECYNSNIQKVYREEMLRLLPLVDRAEKPYVSDQMLQIMSFAEDKTKVTAKVLINELLLHCRGLDDRAARAVK